MLVRVADALEVDSVLPGDGDLVVVVAQTLHHYSGLGHVSLSINEDNLVI